MWTDDAQCRGMDPARVFGSHNATILRDVCAVCPVREPCLWSALLEEYGTDGGANHGHRFFMRGGMTAWDRGELTRRLSRYEIRRRYTRAVTAWADVSSVSSAYAPAARAASSA